MESSTDSIKKPRFAVFFMRFIFLKEKGCLLKKVNTLFGLQPILAHTISNTKRSSATSLFYHIYSYIQEKEENISHIGTCQTCWYLSLLMFYVCFLYLFCAFLHFFCAFLRFFVCQTRKKDKSRGFSITGGQIGNCFLL